MKPQDRDQRVASPQRSAFEAKERERLAAELILAQEEHERLHRKLAEMEQLRLDLEAQQQIARDSTERANRLQDQVDSLQAVEDSPPRLEPKCFQGLHAVRELFSGKPDTVSAQSWKELLDAKAKVSKLTKERMFLHGQVSNLKLVQSDLENERDGLQNEKCALQEHLEQLEEEVGEVQHEKARLEHELSQFHSAAAGELDALHQLETQVSQLERSNQCLEAALAERAKRR